ncbi:glycosyl hydrolase family 85-domain-containing protein [Mycotypha africana]|uniref:glycosyl hydrolase family 85-domain-containing protein n=1 Tax=Mycotypha africana TaxID=64632 RepID=UPI002300FCB9|nr:glycosyl hydrolase family 85-domain-containing protein [Mycotypha africana]KAI8979579.1 glycosyl hydrolase family 85-domain-containing protein [Mycotypha africana]
MPSRKLQRDSLSPRCFALKSLSELREWKATPEDIYNIPNIALQPRRQIAQRPKLLIIHDMAGGYTEDKYIQGNNYQEIYNFQHWHLVDCFVYFAHERVCIPPVNWSNICHRNGVPCLGTFIIEGKNLMHEMETLLSGNPLEDDNNADPLEI